MKRKTFRHRAMAALAVGMALLTAGCATEEDFIYDVVDGGPQLQLTLTMQDAQLATRATEAGVDAFNENKIETVDVFLYKQGDDPATNDALVVKSGTADADGNVAMKISYAQIQSLFTTYEDGQTLTAYVLVNRPSGTPLPSETDVTTLNRLALTCNTFAESTLIDPDNEDQGRKAAIPASFVMSGTTSNITLGNSKGLLSGTAQVSRAAAKVTLTLTRIVQTAEAWDEENDPDHTGSKESWHPLRDNIRVELVNGQTKGYVDAPALTVSDDGYFSTTPIGPKAIRMVPKTDEPDYVAYSPTMTPAQAEAIKYVHEVPFYTYPTNWKRDINHRAHLLLTVFWVKEGESTYRPTYYEIPINDLDELLLRNTHYHIMMDVSIVGSFKREKAVNVSGCYYTVLPWGSASVDGTGTSTSAALKSTRFLVASETEAVMNNVDAYTIPFVSSHYGDDALEIVDISLERMYTLDPVKSEYRETYRSATYTGGNTATYDKYGGTDATKKYTARPFNVVVTQPASEGKTGYITVEHKLNNVMTSEGDFTPYRITFTIRHKDHPEFSETITLTQYPMIYIEVDPNTDFTEDYSSSATNAQKTIIFNNHHGYIFVNNSIGSNSYWYNTSSVSYSLGNNNNPNRYIVKISSLTDDNYKIGDPRTKEISLPEGPAWYKTVVQNIDETVNWPKTTKEVAPRALVENSAYSTSWYGKKGSSSTNITCASTATYLTETPISDPLPSAFGTRTNIYNGGYTSEANAYESPYYDEKTKTHVYYYTWAKTTSRTDFKQCVYRVTANLRAPYYYNTLMYYYPTNSSMETKDMLALAFMVASSYGKMTLTNATRENAIKRCAAYQEDGYPAGRWRVPTYAEVNFMSQLSEMGSIPTLYEEGSTYWCAQGAITLNAEGGSLSTTDTDKHAVRCVYDTWLWGDDKCDINTFTWGDRER